jgi:phenylacetic acid degradation operon negative regulatory protein
MKASTEEFLNLLLWSVEMLTRPTLRNLTDSYESWAFRKGLMRTVATLERRQLVERDASLPEDRVYRLTWQGRLRALGGRDPQAQWSREWDGRWRMVLFDIPITRNTDRTQLRRYLCDRYFGYLQNSVWISPDSLEQERNLMVGGRINVESLVLLEARPCAGETDADIVSGAWNFDLINQRYARHLEILDQRPTGSLRQEATAKALLQWAAAEREAWLDAVTNDPLLPEGLLPSGYVGQQAWRRKVEVLKAAGRQLRTFDR